MGLGSGAFRTGSCRRALPRTRTGGPLAAATCLTVQHPCAWRVVQMLSGGRASPGPQSGCGLGVLTAPPGNPVSASRDVLQGGSSGGAAGPSHSSPSGGGGGTQPADDKGLYLGFFSQFICRQHGGFLGPGNPPGCWTLGQDAPNASPPCRTTPGHSGKVSAPARPPHRHLQLYVDLIKSAEPRTFRLRRAHSGPQKTDSE